MGNDRGAVASARELARLLATGQGESLLALYVYGSRLPGRDLDMMALFAAQPTPGELCAGGLDLHCVGLERARYLLRHRDPLIVEPLVTGELVVGDDETHESLMADLDASSAGPETVRHLLHSALSCYQGAVQQVHAPDPRGRERGLRNLDFAITYLGLAREYAVDASAPFLSIEGLMELHADVRALRGECHRLRGSTDSDRGANVVGFLSRFENWLLLPAIQ